MREEIIGGQRLILGDCLDVLPSLAAGSVDAVITDPPYGLIGNQGDWWKLHAGQKSGKALAAKRVWGSSEWAYVDPPEGSIEWIVASGLPAIVWGGNYLSHRLTRSSCWFVWDKQTNGDFGDAELAWTNIPGVVRLFQWMWNGCIMKVREERVHPTQKPTALLTWCIERAKVADGATVLDPFMGSGTTLVAAERLGRRGIGIEIDEGYYEIALRRVEEAVKKRQDDAAQLTLTG